MDDEAFAFFLRAPREAAEAARRRLRAADLLEPRVQVERGPDAVSFPVTDREAAEVLAGEVGGEVVRMGDPVPRTPHRAPREEARRRLEGVLPSELLDEVPRGWDRVGDVVVLKLPDPLVPHREAVGEAFGEALDARSVLWDRAGIEGELRTPAPRELLWGDRDTATVHREDGIGYELDPREVMFASGNVDERVRMGRVDASGETVVDLFAGVGYLSLPLAVHGDAARVVAVERNPVSVRFLTRNADRNGVGDVVDPVLGDNACLDRAEGVADRVLLGYLPGTARFLPRALRVARPGAVLHHHDTCPVEEAPDAVAQAVVDAAGEAGRSARVLGVRVVKSTAPGIVHAVADVRVG